ncbi:putative disease resistance protein RGA3, partial [Carex rostrata]
MSHKIKDLSSRMKKVSQRRSDFGLDVNASSTTRDRLEITTSLPPTHTVGRENESTKILGMLIPYNDVQVGILTIYGLGRIGKTTLAQLIYNELNKQGDFNMTLWVQVSYEFDLEKVTRSILDSMGEPQVRDIDAAQKRIQMNLEGKRYLLVLDDFSNENIFEWEKLIRPLQKGAPGSIIIVTTSNELVARMVSTIFSFHLKELSGNNCYSLVYHYASRNDTNAIAKLNAQRSEIINKCKGMPEEAINLGGRLRQQHDEEKWNEIIVKWGEGHTFSEESRSINSMRLHNLPSYLKSCLAYCSIIPKGKQFKKDWIIQLWMAQNFIAKQDQQRIEDIGNTYFDWLVARSFFQKTGISLNKDRYEYHIPNIVHESVQEISAKECCIFEFGKSDKPANSTRHISIIVTGEQLRNNPNLFTEIYHCKGLYTLLVVGDFLTNHPLRLPNDIFNRLGKLRTLDLSYCNLGSLPKNIGDLIHLRCLQLQNSNIQELPKSVGDLYNLQTLGLRNCYSLRKLPKEIKCLQKLLHLDLHLDHVVPNDDQRLESMPPYIGLLTNLRVLSRFVVSKRKHCGLNELRNLNSLQGGLSISNLDLVKNSNDAIEANLQEKRHIERLELLWRGNGG